MTGRDVVVVAIVAVAVILGLEVVTTLVPGAAGLLAGTPLLIVVLIVGTAAILWRIATRRPPDG
jgi:hypothetical protein